MRYRKNIRLKNYDYKNNGAYFITICTDQRKNIINEQIKEILIKEFLDLEKRFNGIKIDYYKVMQNHIHCIILLNNSFCAICRIIQTYKSITTLKIKQFAYNENLFWQKNYYEHIIRNETALMKIRIYIENNPLQEKLEFDEIYDKTSRASSTTTER